MQLKYKFAAPFFITLLFIFSIRYWVGWVMFRCRHQFKYHRDSSFISQSVIALSAHRNELFSVLLQKAERKLSVYSRQAISGGKWSICTHCVTLTKKTDHLQRQSASLTYLECSLQTVSDTEYRKLRFWELSGMIYLIYIISCHRIYLHINIITILINKIWITSPSV